MTEPRVEAGDRALETARKIRDELPFAIGTPERERIAALIQSAMNAQVRELRGMLRKLIATCKLSTLFSPAPLDLDNEDATFEDDFCHTVLEAERLLAERGEAK